MIAVSKEGKSDLYIISLLINRCRAACSIDLLERCVGTTSIYSANSIGLSTDLLRREVVPFVGNPIRMRGGIGWNRGSTALHLAMTADKHGEIVRLLLDAEPMVAAVKSTWNHFTPLHMACSSRTSVSVVRLLISKYPQAADVADIKGCRSTHGP